MSIRINLISLAVADLKKSRDFYRDGLNLRIHSYTDSDDHFAFDLQEGLTLVLYPRSEIAKLTADENMKPSSNEIIFSYSAADKNEVQKILSNAEKHGAELIQDQGHEEDWGYSGYFKDPDGHVWEIMWTKKHLNQ